jgi:hypothetical protein
MIHFNIGLKSSRFITQSLHTNSCFGLAFNTPPHYFIVQINNGLYCLSIFITITFIYISRIFITIDLITSSISRTIRRSLISIFGFINNSNYHTSNATFISESINNFDFETEDGIVRYNFIKN